MSSYTIQFNASINQIARDNVSGSSVILQKTIKALKKFLSLTDFVRVNELRAPMENLVHQKPFASLINFFLEIFPAGELNGNLSFLSSLFLKTINAYEEKWKNAEGQTALNFLSKINCKNKTILLHSNSSTVVRVFRLLAAKKSSGTIHIFQTISYPDKEGILQGKILANLGFKVEMINDASIGLFAGKADFAVVGADAVLPHYFINKTGTFLIGLACRYYKKPLYVLADTRKFITSYIKNQKGYTSLRVSQNWWTKRYNLEKKDCFGLFEQVPVDFANIFITEKGINSIINK